MAKFSDITGRYIYLELDCLEYRVYIEEAGKGIPLVCQHTAGSDGRQYRHILEDRDITSRFHVVAADLPYQGKSLPPASVRYWEQEYKLTKDWFMRYWVTLCHELQLDRPVYMGCSMGGHLAPDLAQLPERIPGLHRPGGVDVERQYRSIGEPVVPPSSLIKRIEAGPHAEPVLAERAGTICSRDGLGIQSGRAAGIQRRSVLLLLRARSAAGREDRWGGRIAPRARYLRSSAENTSNLRLRWRSGWDSN